MSVMHFTPDELGPLAALAIGNTSSDAGKRRLTQAVKGLAAYSAANSQAYAHTYHEETAPYSEDEIMRRAKIRDDIQDWNAAINTAHLLRYNLVANDGTDFATIRILTTILQLVQDIARKTVMTPIKNLSNSSAA